MNDDEPTASPEEGSPHFVVSQLFRDAFACHLYMLFSVMFFMESEAKIGSSIKTGGKNSNKHHRVPPVPQEHANKTYVS